jgi:5-hydroxyisourate hydrolase-like protein (transthyretin family)
VFHCEDTERVISRSVCSTRQFFSRENCVRTINLSDVSKKRLPKLKYGRIAANLLVMSILLALIVGASASQLAFAQTTTPVADAFVTASSTTGGEGYGTATSNAQGFYNITTFLDSGNYSVEASAIGFIDTSVENVRVTGGQETPNVNILLPVSGAISGRVTDAATGTPASFVEVEASNATTGDSISSGLTDSSGNYLINTNLATGTYNVTAAFAAGYLMKTVGNVAVTAGATTSNVNFALNKSAIITGTVTDSVTSAALSGIAVYASSSTSGFAAAAVTNSSGKYTMNTNLGTGTYNVSVLLPAGHISNTITGVAVTAGNQYTVNVPLNPSGIISGRVTTTTGTPVAGASVTASAGTNFGFATTNATGYYRITDGLDTGSYTVFASYGGGFATATGVSVTRGQETGNVDLQLTLLPSGTITGRVTNTTGSPISLAYVSAEGLTGSGSAYTDDNGVYTINTGLLTGTYNVTAEATGYGAMSQTGVSVTIGQTTPNIDFQLVAIPSGRISGFVQATGTPIPEFQNEFYVLAIFCAASIIIVLTKLRTTHVEPSTPL